MGEAKSQPELCTDSATHILLVQGRSPTSRLPYAEKGTRVTRQSGAGRSASAELASFALMRQRLFSPSRSKQAVAAAGEEREWGGAGGGFLEQFFGLDVTVTLQRQVSAVLLR